MCLEGVLDNYVSAKCDKTVYVAYAEEKYMNEAKAVVSKLEKSGIATYSDIDRRSLKSQMKRANKYGFRWVLILNKGEVEEGKCSLKDLSSEGKEQYLIGLMNIEEEIEKKIVY